jgi:hypothetical protein
MRAIVSPLLPYIVLYSREKGTQMAIQRKKELGYLTFNECVEMAENDTKDDYAINVRHGLFVIFSDVTIVLDPIEEPDLFPDPESVKTYLHISPWDLYYSLPEGSIICCDAQDPPVSWMNQTFCASGWLFNPTPYQLDQAWEVYTHEYLGLIVDEIVSMDPGR